MKTNLTLILVLTLTVVINRASAQTYNVTSSGIYSALGLPSTCNTCTFNISTGIKLTINSNVTLKEATFNGGSVDINNSTITINSGGTKTTTFNNTSVAVKNSNIIVNPKLALKNTTMIFSASSNILVNNRLDMDGSSMKFLDNSFFNSPSGITTLYNGSSLVAGDGSPSSTAYIKLDGADLILLDNSFISVANFKNAYINLNKYYAVQPNWSILTITTTGLNLNCGTPGKNACSAPNINGPATLTISGVSINSVLPVKLSAFAVKSSGSKVDLSWTTDMEMKADRYQIERSMDGIHWAPLGIVKAKGNSSNTTSYNFTDLVKISGTISYRLKMIDQDESFTYSPIKSVRAEAVHEMNVFPNPAADYVVINSKNGSSDKLNIQLINQNGQILKQVNGGGMVNVSLSEFKTGNYVVRVSDSEGGSQSFKLVIKK